MVETQNLTPEAESAGAKRVLVADDEPNIVRLVKLHLEKAGHKVECAYDGKEALEKALTNSYDLIILDVMMPQMDGIEVLRAIRLDPTTEGTPVIILSARTQENDVARGYIAGADLYLRKPFQPTELMTLVARL